MSEAKGFVYTFISLFFRLLYSPISILEDINKFGARENKPRNWKQIVRYSASVLIVQLVLLIAILTFLIALLLLYFDAKSVFSIYVPYFGVGCLIGIVFILIATSLFLPSVLKVSDRVVSFLRALTRVWLFAVIFGLMTLLINFLFEPGQEWLGKTRLIVIAVLLGFYIQKTFQLMIIANEVDSKGIETKKEILIAERHSRRVQRSITLAIQGLNTLIWVSFLDRFGIKNWIYIYLISFAAIGWIFGLHFRAIGYSFMLKVGMNFFFLSPRQRLAILATDEIIHRGLKIHRKHLEAVADNDPDFYFYILEKYYENTPHTFEIFELFLEKIDTPFCNERLENYLNITTKATLIRELDVSFWEFDYNWKMEMPRKILLDIFDLRRKVDSDMDLLPILSKQNIGFNYLKEFRDFFQGTRDKLDFRKKMAEYESDISTKYKIRPGAYFDKINQILFREITFYIEERQKDVENFEITVSILENYLTFTNQTGYMSIQVRNNEKKYIYIEDCKITFSPEGHLDTQQFDFEKSLEPTKILEFFVPLKLEIEIESSCDIEIEVHYKNERNEFKVKQFRKTLSTILIKEFKPLDNPFTLKPVRTPGMFFGRKDVLDAIFEKISSKNYPSIITITAERRLGKTSLLRYFESVKVEGFETVYLDMMSFVETGSNDLNAFLPSMLKEIGILADGDYTRIGINEFLRMLSVKKFILLFDEFDVFAHHFEYEEFLRKLRNNENENRSIFIFSLPRNRLDNLRIEGKNILLSEAVYNLWPFEKRTAVDLITKPVKNNLVITPGAIEYIYYLCGGFPIYIQAFCSELVRYVNAERRSPLVNEDVVKNIEQNSPEDFGSKMHVYLSSIEKDYIRILKVLKSNGNKIHKRDIALEINKEFQIGNIQRILTEMEKENLVHFRGNYLECTSKILLTELDRIRD